MVEPENIGTELSELIDAHFEWLLIRENGRTFPLQKSEIEVIDVGRKTMFGFFDDGGFRSRRVARYSIDDLRIRIDLSEIYGQSGETVSLIPRTSAAELSRNIVLARLEKANDLASMVIEAHPALKLVRVSLNAENGRLAQIIVESKTGGQKAILSDVTNVCTAETLLTTAVLWLSKLQSRRKKPIYEIWLIGERKEARNLQKLNGLLGETWKKSFRIFETSRKKGDAEIRPFTSLKLTDLWREKPKKLVLPSEIELSESACEIVALAPEKIDIISSRQGETLRFLGLPFARVRTILDKEKAWFGIDKKRQPLNEGSRGDFLALLEKLDIYRRSNSTQNRHELYRLAPEAWLESILRRNIKLLDANLILSPIYNQFRTSADKIDLLALRRDGRLVIVELKTSPDREMVFQAADYWRKIEMQRRRGELKKARVFGDLEILDKPALVYAVAPALSFHRDFGRFAQMLAKEIELWRFELHEDWRNEIKIISRRNYADQLLTNL